MEEKLYYDSSDGIKLCGLLSKVNSSDNIVILCHGLLSNKKSSCFNFLVKKFQAEKINSFRFDFRSLGESEGIDYEMTPTKEIIDLESTINYLKSIGFDKIILLGSSFGGGIVSLLDYDRFKCIKGIVCWYAGLDYSISTNDNQYFIKEHSEIAKKNGWFKIERNAGKIYRLGKELFEEVYQLVPYKNLIKVDLPILFVHGLIDKMVPYELSVKVSNMCKNSKLELIENGDHSFKNNEKALIKACNVTIQFIKEIFNN